MRRVLAVRRPASGVTLIELMVALAIVGVLALVIVPAYTSNVQKSRRVDAKNALLDLAAREEKFYASNNSYIATAAQLNYSSASFPITISSSGTPSYTLDLPAPTLSVSGFTATASPIGPQASDACGIFTITDTGAETSSGPQTSPPCW